MCLINWKNGADGESARLGRRLIEYTRSVRVHCIIWRNFPICALHFSRLRSSRRWSLEGVGGRVYTRASSNVISSLKGVVEELNFQRHLENIVQGWCPGCEMSGLC